MMKVSYVFSLQEKSITLRLFSNKMRLTAASCLLFIYVNYTCILGFREGLYNAKVTIILICTKKSTDYFSIKRKKGWEKICESRLQ